MSTSKANVVVFTCNWDGLSCVEAAAQTGLTYPASVRVVRITCLSRLHHGLLLKAFEVGADGVLLLGCEPGRCQFDTDAALVEQECHKARKLMKLLGLTEERLVVAYVPRGDGSDFVGRLTSFIEELEHMEPAVPGRA
jgi:coenzyme F420-reducing hydrogenase delta subunit